jgi:hypothetical protein
MGVSKVRPAAVHNAVHDGVLGCCREVFGMGHLPQRACARTRLSDSGVVMPTLVGITVERVYGDPDEVEAASDTVAHGDSVALPTGVIRMK